MRKVRKDMRSLFPPIHTFSNGLFDRFHGRSDLIPRYGCLDRVYGITHIPECVAQISCPEAVFSPGLTHPPAQGDASVPPEDRCC